MIVDASVAMKWLIPEADSVAADSLADRDDLMAPGVLPFEVGDVLTKQIRRGAISAEAAREAWNVFRTTPLQIMAAGAEVDDAFDLSLQLGVNFYDCVYLALAIRQDDVLVTADESFVRAVRSSKVRRGQDRVMALAEVPGEMA